jgi:hypothetical protein
MKKKGFFNIVSLNDVHCPFQDSLAVDVAIKFCGFIQPDIIILHEWHDFYNLSRFDKDPLREESLQYEIDEVKKYFWAIRKLCPKSRIILLNSNHLDRLKKYCWRQAQALSSLNVLKIEKLLELSEFKIEYMEDFTHENFLFTHGNIVRKDSGMTARTELQREGVSGCSGHTHRLGVHYKTLRGGSYVWLESGCLCKLNPEYIEGTADWQQGISLISFKPNSDHFYAQVLPIINYQILWGNTIIE